MPLRSSSAQSAKSSALGSPYSPRRSSGQPRTSRMQYSACGACRMRRVRCDLKDQPYTGAGQPQCGNCTERGLRCVDEFADVKAVKLLRRGRRLQQVEAVYGKTADEEGIYGLPTLTPNLIAKLKPEFFSSNFFHRFFIQHPIIDPTEFLSRFFEFSKGNCNALGIAGQLIAMILVVWGVSFGVNEYGIEEPSTDAMTTRNRREATNDLVREILQLIDIHGILRKPSFDGIRAVMLLLPLTEDVQTPTERLVMHEMIVTHVYTLCNLTSLSSVGNGQNQTVDPLVRARIFWYVHITEGITAGLRGGRTVLSEDDLVAFNNTLDLNMDNNSLRALQPLDWWSRFSAAPLRLASVCRKIHTRISGPKVRLNTTIDEAGILEIWDSLDKTWSDLDALRQLPKTHIPIVHDEDVVRHCDGWQIFIFECHAVIREALKQRGLVHPVGQSTDAAGILPGSASSLLQASEARCHALARRVVAIIKQHLLAGSQFFEYDSTLARDGCFFAGFLLASGNGTEEEVGYCLKALKLMRWAFSNSEERVKTVTMAWEARRCQTRGSSPSSFSSGDSPTHVKSLLDHHTRPVPPPLSIPSVPNPIMMSLPGSAFTDESQFTTPPGSASSSKHSFFGDLPGCLSTQSSPGSSRHVSSGGSPSSGFVTPALLHFPHSAGAPDDITGLSPPHVLFYGGDDMSSYQLSAQHSSHAIHSSPSTMSLRPIPSSPHALISGGSPQSNLHDMYQQHATLFDPRALVFPDSDSSHNVSTASADVLDQAFNLTAAYF